ncbi:Putative peptidoglycan O-acetyltransferase yrhL [Actinoplanes sp. SE50]|uniref:acyltransferase family protein n=1 Tax=unclassified Actinoplanes TaxID=2626549 RepID=UPI00023EBEF4|nr:MULTISPECIES: acyltransferase [unclassified Actinoplanes]AEV84023.1 Putative peptidoglycan O-acetyltransferase yrhL [Actinoplanes sp. SE50/110]ATO82416.1 Putative peptidoglycan O-acetyltransferase yrhL [Actinoplanes sp. SE50]SLL99823.1 acyltransferase [Actinoplanes sp. SE50/110]
MRAPIWTRRSVDEAFSAPGNSFGFLRLLFAFAVLVSHSLPLGYGREDPGGGLTHGQTVLGEIGILGFFTISGFLITRSAGRVPLPRYLWHRGLRILPGLWVCLIVTALVVAPVVALIEHGSVAGVFAEPGGPFGYVFHNLAVAIRQYGISGLLRDTPYGRLTGESVFDGSLWSLMYEVFCYFMIAGLALTGLLKRARWVVAALAGGLFAVIVHDFLTAPRIPGPQGVHGPFLGIGGIDTYSLVYLTYVFLLGALFELYRSSIVLNELGAIVAAVILLGTTQCGGFDVLGYPAFAYLTLWLAIALPAPFRRIGVRQDYSYGFYIYAFPVQQLLALLGVPAWGLLPYILLATAGTLVFAIPSWHLVERPAMALKHWSPRQRTTAGDQASGTNTAGAPLPLAGTVQTSLADGPVPERGRP